MCEQMGTEPDPEFIPLEPNDLDYESQMALKMFSVLPDRIDGASGTWLGKELSGLGTFLEVFEVDYPRRVCELLFIIVSEADAYYRQQQKARQASSKLARR